MADISIKIDKGEGQDEAREEIVSFINDISKKYNLNYFELLGIFDVVRMDIHIAAMKEDEE